jgi:hypothetical protein
MVILSAQENNKRQIMHHRRETEGVHIFEIGLLNELPSFRKNLYQSSI